MAQVHTIQTNFSSGELDPKMAFRIDTGAFQNGAASLRNGLLHNSGGCSRRPGMRYKATLPGLARLVPFEFSADQRYCFAFSNGRLDVYVEGSLVASVTSGCNWTTATLFEFTYAQVADVMIVCHRDWRTQVIRRTGATSFTVSNFSFEQSLDGLKIYQPYYKFADDAVTLSASAAAGSVTLTASAAVFSSNLVGERLRWQGVEIEVTAYTNATTLTGTVKGSLQATYDLNPFRTTAGSNLVEVSHIDHGFSSGQTIFISGANGVGGITSAGLNGNRVITVIDDHRYSFAAATSATDSVDGGGPNVKYTSNNTATRNWAEPALCNRNGWPGAVAFHEGRLWFAGSSGIPDGVWSSKTYRYFNFDVGDGADSDSIQVTVGADDISNVRHMVSHRNLQVFSANGEFFVPSPTNAPITPTNIRIKRQTPYGSAMVSPQPFDGATLFVQAAGNCVREYLYADGTDGYAATNLNVLSSHLIATPKDMAVMFGSGTLSEQYAYVINTDGTMAVFFSARSENLAGWVPWALSNGGKFRSACALGGQVYFTIERDGVFTLELLEQDRAYTLDSSSLFTAGSPTTGWALGSRWIGKTVHVLSGSDYFGTFVVPGSGEITLPVAVSSILVGYAAPFEIETLPVNLQLPNGPMTGLPKRINRVIVGLDSTLAVSISGNRLLLRQVTDDFSNGLQAVTGTREFFLLGWQRDAIVTVSQQEPLPCTVLGLLLEVTA